MPAVHEIISTLNQFAQARLPAAGWRGGSFDATRFIPAGWMRLQPAMPEAPEVPESAYARAGTEPPLEEMLSDPVVQLIMQADHLEPAEVRRQLAAVRRHRATPADPGAICPQ
ncbi:MAG: hypothetical protein ACREJ5_27565 [Geminicoccaceae bacterium]